MQYSNLDFRSIHVRCLQVPNMVSQGTPGGVQGARVRGRPTLRHFLENVFC